jgi:3-phosphoshikimate 1-carboxyvinyltransferase
MLPSSVFFVDPSLPKICFIEKRSRRVQHSMLIPGSKSVSNRVVVLAAMQNAPLEIHGFLMAQDTYFGLHALEQLGFSVILENGVISLTPPKISPAQNLTLSLGRAGTLARFFPAVILNWQETFPHLDFLNVILDGDHQLRHRPLTPLIMALQQLGGRLSASSLPLGVSSSQLKGNCTIDGNVSGQFLSGLLLAAHGSRQRISITRLRNLVQPDYVRITLKMIAEFGGGVEADSPLTHFQLGSFLKQRNAITRYHVEADASTACYFIALACLHGFSLTVPNLGSSTLQPDFQFVFLLREWGYPIQIFEHHVLVEAKSTAVSPHMPVTLDASALSDQALTMAIFSLFASHPVEITGISHIRHHESDRIGCLVKNLRGLGFSCDEKSDGFVVVPNGKPVEEIAGDWVCYEDHRFVMTGFLLASLSSRVRLVGTHAVEKTAPQFFALMETLGFFARAAQ